MNFNANIFTVLYVKIFDMLRYVKKLYKLFENLKKNDDKLKPNKNYLKIRFYVFTRSFLDEFQYKYLYVKIFDILRYVKKLYKRFENFNKKNDDKLKKSYPSSLSLSLSFSKISLKTILETAACV